MCGFVLFSSGYRGIEGVICFVLCIGLVGGAAAGEVVSIVLIYRSLHTPYISRYSKSGGSHSTVST